MYQIITFAAAAGVVLLLLLLTKKGSGARINILKTLTVLFCALGFFRQWMTDSIVYVINGGWLEEVYYEMTDYLQIILRWGYLSAYSVIPLAVFTKSRVFRNIAGYVTVPFAALSAIYFDDFMAYFTAKNIHGFVINPTLRAVLFAAELTLAIAIPVALHIGERHYFKVKSLTEWISFLFSIVGVALVSVPTYLPQAFFGTSQLKPPLFKSFHLLWLAATLTIIIALYYIFRFRPYKDRYALCLFLVLTLFFHYNSLYTMGFTLKRLPFQLCNIAAYFFLIAIVFKLKSFFHFTFLANTVGTIFAMVGPDFGAGETSFFTIHFIYEHALVLIIPALMAGLRIFPRVTLKSLKPLFIGYTCYFLFCFTVGTIMNGYSDVTGETVNYFYMFDLKTALDYFPFLKFATEHFFTFGRFVVYPIVVSIVYFGFFGLTLLFYAFVRALYKFEDDHLALRVSSIDLYEKITGKKSRRPRDYID